MRRQVLLATVLAAALLAPATAAAQGADIRLSYQGSESGKVAVDRSSHGNDGTMAGGVTTVNGAYRFHPLSRNPGYDRISTPSDPSLNPGTSPFSYSIRVKVSPTAEWSHSEMAVLRHGDSDQPGGDYKTELRKNETTGVVSTSCIMHDDDGSGFGYIRGTPGGITINDGHWHTIICSRLSVDTTSLSIDGHTIVRPTRGDLGNIEGDVPLLIGCQLAGDLIHRREQFVGKMDDITITVH